MSFALAQYRSTKVETASPVRIVVQLYDGAIRFMRQAQHAMRAEAAAERGLSLRKAHAIVAELQATLDASQAPELCAELERLYDFVLHRITEANNGNAPAPEALDPAIDVMGQLRGAWDELAQKAG